MYARTRIGSKAHRLATHAERASPTRFITGALATVGLAVVLIIVVAVGVFAYDEAKRRLVGDELTPEPPTEGSGA